MPLPRFDKLDPPRKKSILAAAAEEFGEHGFEHASYNRIIERAGISKGAMYYYFADKDDLYRTVLGAALTEWLTHVGFPFEADDGASFWRACEVIYDKSIRFMLDDPKNAALCMSITQARARMGGHPVIVELNERMMEWTRALVEKGQAVGAVRTDIPSDLLVHAGLALMDAGDRWLASRWSSISADDVDGLAATMVGLFRSVGGSDG